MIEYQLVGRTFVEVPLKGQRYGHWTVLKEMERLATNDPWGSIRQVACKCDCGRVRPVQLSNLLGGRSRSCMHCAPKRPRSAAAAS